jgi:ABC-2 type transport system ATP-binding protein
VRQGLRALCDEDGIALLVTSHDMVEVERLAERVIFLAGGKVVADGTPADVVATFGHGNLEDVFLALAGEFDGVPDVETHPHEETARP